MIFTAVPELAAPGALVPGRPYAPQVIVPSVMGAAVTITPAGPLAAAVAIASAGPLAASVTISQPS